MLSRWSRYYRFECYLGEVDIIDLNAI
jgi:hypothetical protein